MLDDTIAIDGRTVVVPAFPLNTTVTISSLVRPRIRIQDERLVLELHRGVRPFGMLIVTWGITAAALGILAVLHQWHTFAMIIGLGQGIVLPAIGIFLILLPCRHEFDRVEETYRRRSAISPGVWPLKRIVAVQTILGTIVETSDDSGTFRHQTYQLNLVTDDDPRRIAVTCTTGSQWVTEAGRTISEFLNIPLISRIAP